jgi:hypothetical protein
MEEAIMNAPAGTPRIRWWIALVIFACLTATIMAWLFWPPKVLNKTPFPSEELVNLASRLHMPMPQENAPLVLAQTQDDFCSSYVPAFLLEETPDGIIVLRGTERKAINQQFYNREPLYIPFPRGGFHPTIHRRWAGYNREAMIACCVQLATRGDNEIAQQIWNRINPSLGLVDSQEKASVALNNPRLFLAECICYHLENFLVRGAQYWPDVYTRLNALFDEFPELKRNQEHRTIFDRLYATINAPAPAPGSTEALLITWSTTPTNGPEEIIARGADAVRDLIPLLIDQRLTAHAIPDSGVCGGVRLSTDMRPPASYSLGELARQVLETITGTNEHDGIGAGSWRGPPDATDFRRWFRDCEFFGEATLLGDRLFDRTANGDITRVNESVIPMLIRRFPQALPGLCEEFIKHARTNNSPISLMEAVSKAQLPTETKAEIITAIAKRGFVADCPCCPKKQPAGQPR